MFHHPWRKARVRKTIRSEIFITNETQQCQKMGAASVFFRVTGEKADRAKTADPVRLPGQHPKRRGAEAQRREGFD
jgi:hypothetical protein